MVHLRYNENDEADEDMSIQVNAYQANNSPAQKSIAT